MKLTDLISAEDFNETIFTPPQPGEFPPIMAEHLVRLDAFYKTIDEAVLEGARRFGITDPRAIAFAQAEARTCLDLIDLALERKFGEGSRAQAAQ